MGALLSLRWEILIGAIDSRRIVPSEVRYQWIFCAGLFDLANIFWHKLVVARIVGLNIFWCSIFLQPMVHTVCCRSPCAEPAPAEVDRVIKTRVTDVILYLTLCHLAQLFWTRIDFGVKPLQSPGSLCSGTIDDKSFSDMTGPWARAQTRAHRSHYVALALRRVWHMLMRQALLVAGSASRQKPKSFSPPSPVTVSLMERRSGNNLSPTQSGKLTNLST